MSDADLLDLAARAQGWFDYPTDSIEQGMYWHTDRATAPFDHHFPKSSWIPLDDDGQALRLAVKLEMQVHVRGGGVLAHARGLEMSCTEPLGDAPYAATRRAIVRCAAAIHRQR